MQPVIGGASDDLGTIDFETGSDRPPAPFGVIASARMRSHDPNVHDFL
ncbi:MAG: hypothetical protein ACLP8S_15255 [Solirubrobacteraceae bacterium]